MFSLCRRSHTRAPQLHGTVPVLKPVFMADQAKLGSLALLLAWLLGLNRGYCYGTRLSEHKIRGLTSKGFSQDPIPLVDSGAKHNQL